MWLNCILFEGNVKWYLRGAECYSNDKLSLKHVKLEFLKQIFFRFYATVIRNVYITIQKTLAFVALVASCYEFFF